MTAPHGGDTVPARLGARDAAVPIVRYEGAAARDTLNELYSVARDLTNFFTATTRLVGKKRAGRSVTRSYDEPRTPYRRLRESDLLERTAEQGLEMRLKRMNPAALTREREKLRDRLWELRRRRR